MLIPPGVATPHIATRTFTADVVKGVGACPPSTKPVEIRVRRKRAKVTVDREMLIKQQPGWLGRWAVELESRGCVVPHEGWKLAERIVESLPIEQNTAFRLLYTSQMDVAPRVRLQVVSPVLREGVPAGAIPLETVRTSENSSSLMVTVKADPNLIGYERAWYGVQPKLRSIGTTIAALYAERHVNGVREHRAQPAVNLLRFPPRAGFYRLYQKAGETEFTQFILAGRTPAELEQQVAAFEKGTVSCGKMSDEFCLAIPKAAAVNLYMPVVVNQVQIMVRWGATVREAVQESGERRPSGVQPRLTVLKPYRGRPVPVEFDRASPAIFNLILTGGELISWK